jgi:tetratricopeptide (TPR) repeat protein
MKISMRKLSTVSAVLLAGVLILGASGCNKLKARSHIKDGVLDFKSAHYSDAVEHFKQAAALDPDNINGISYLAVSYMAQWIPGAESPENMELAVKAREGFLKVLEKAPKDASSLEYLGSLAYNQAASLPQDQKLAKYDEAVQWFNQLAKVDPQKTDAYYYMGVIAYNKYHPALMLARVGLHMREDEGPIKDKKVREELKAQYGPIIDDGIANLQKALEVDKEYDPAMAYLNLLIRQKADLLDNTDEYKKQIDIANDWLQKTLDTKKIKAARQPASPGGIVADPNAK